MPGSTEYEFLIHTASNNLREDTAEVNLTGAMSAIRIAKDSLMTAVQGVQVTDGLAEPTLFKMSETINACDDDANRYANGQMPPNDRFITEGPATVLATNVHRALGELNAQWFL
jgi:hypothetical protein